MGNNPILSFLLLWSVEVSLLILVAAGVSHFLRRQPGIHQNALWTCVLFLAFILPITTLILPPLIQWPDKAIITEVRISGFPPEPLPPPKILSSNLNAAAIPAPGATPLPANYFLKKSLEQEDLAEASQTKNHSNRLNLAADALLLIWLLGVAISLSRWVYFRWKIQRIIHSSQPATQSHILQFVERTRQLLFIDQPAQVRLHEMEAAPFVIGILRPKILLPRPLLEALDANALAAVLSHELAHIKRYDLIAHFFMRLLRTILCFLPPVWWLQHELHRTQDMACDECSAVVLGSNMNFGKALTQLAESCLLTEPVFPALGIIHSKSALRARLENIMSNPIHQLVRLSLRYKLTLLMASLTILILPGLVKQAASVQTLQVDYLGNFRGSPESVSVESVFYAEPYYGVVGRMRNAFYAFLFEEQNGQLVESARMRIEEEDRLGDFRLQAIVSHKRVVALLFESNQKPNELLCILIDLLTKQSNKMKFFLNDAPVQIGTTAWQGDSLYVLNTRRNVTGEQYYFLRFDLTDETNLEFIDKIPLPQNIVLQLFGALEDGILFMSEILDNDNPDNNMPKGLSWGEFTSENELWIESYQWFNEEDSTLFHLLTFGPYALIRSFPIPPKPLLLIDWSDKTTPRLIQEIDADFQYAERYRNVGMNDNLLLINDSSSKKQGILVFAKDQGTYKQVSALQNENSGIALGPNYLLTMSLHAYDLSNPATPKPVSFPLESTYILNQVVSNGKYAYAIRQDGRKRWLLSLDTAIPSDVKILESRPLPDNFVGVIQAHHGLLSIQRNKELHLYELQSNGFIGLELVLPSFPNSETFYDLGRVMWSDDLLIIPFNIPQIDENNPGNTPPRYPNLHIYKRNATLIDSTPISTFALPLHSHLMQLNGNWLYMFSTDLTSQGDTVPLSIYSLENVARPELVTLFNIPKRENPYQGDPFPRKDPYSIREFVVNDQYLIYGGNYLGSSSEIAIVDIHDPRTPKHFNPISIEVRSLVQKDSSFAVATSDSLILYTVDPEKGPAEAGRISSGGKSNNYLSLSDDRLYITRREQGMDIYQFKLDATEVGDWFQFE